MRQNARFCALGMTSAMALALTFTACSKNEDAKISLGLQQVEPIVVEVTPSGFASGSASLSGVKPLGSCNSVLDGASFLSCLAQTSLSETQPDGAVGQWYLWWIKSLDNRIEEFNTRFTAVPTCLSETPTDVTFDLSGIASGTALPTLTVPLQCFETLSTPNNEGSMDLSFSKANGKVYVVNRSTNRYNNTDQFIITIAETDEDGTEAKIWVLMGGTQSIPSGGNYGSVAIMRIYANKSTGEFAYNWLTNDYQSNDFTNVFVRSNGNDGLYVRGRSGSSLTTDFDFGSSATSVCLTPSDLSVTSTSCTGLDVFPSSTSGISLGATSRYTPDQIQLSATYDHSQSGAGILKNLREIDLANTLSSVAD